MSVPLTRPEPPRLSEAGDALRQIEQSGWFSNYGPVNSRFETALLDRMFGGQGGCLTVCNATVGLMLAIRHAVGWPAASSGERGRRRYALMPSFTFAAAAQAALWCGLTPLFCDADPTDWAACAAAEAALLARHGADIAVVVPYATFGYDIDLGRYAAMTRRHGVPVVVDAAASLGTIQADGRGFGAGFPGSVVFSMHATKSFAVGEGGLIYSADRSALAELRTMANFGFGAPREATTIGLNGKLSEVAALLGERRLADYDRVMDHRAELVGQYRAALPELAFQPAGPRRQAHQFASALLPPELGGAREAVRAGLQAEGVGSGAYFSPHVAEQAFFAANSLAGPLPVTAALAGRVISLPLFDSMTRDDVRLVVGALARQLDAAGRERRRPEALQHLRRARRGLRERVV